LPISDDTDPEILISRLAGPLAPSAREAFRRAAEASAVAVLQRDYFEPPDDSRAAWDITQERHQATKLTQGPPIGHGRNPRLTRHLRLTR
jgi:hypothetical protein